MTKFQESYKILRYFFLYDWVSEQGFICAYNPPAIQIIQPLIIQGKRVKDTGSGSLVRRSSLELGNSRASREHFKCGLLPMRTRVSRSVDRGLLSVEVSFDAQGKLRRISYVPAVM